MRKTAIIFGLVFFSMLGGAMTVAAEDGSAVEEAQTVGRTPPRLSFLDGQVSFWRPGAQDWTQAQINTALAPGDQLYIEGSGNLELQIGAQAYVRGGRDAQIGLETQEPDFLRFKVTGGRVAFDLRTLSPGRTVEVDTPHGAFIMNRAGYFRLEVGADDSIFTTRRSGRANVLAGGGDAVPMEPDESVVLAGPSQKSLAFQAAPELDPWDTWNYERTDALLEAASPRYVAPDTYGAAELDRYGSWRVLPTYGAVWVPAGVAPGWAPYSTGSWMYDPYYGWTWVDTAPWGWAPYHYGRWVHVNSYWCWAPGPVVRRAVYSPALVAFFGAPGVSVGISVGGPGVGWVALGWGEPLIPWWGRAGFIHRPWWGGWGGPRCINSRVIHHGTVVTVRDIHHYHNTRIHNALIVVDHDRFGHGRIQRRSIEQAHLKQYRPMHGGPDIRPRTSAYAPSDRHGRRPPEKTFKRSTVTFEPRNAKTPVVSGTESRRGWSSRPAHERQPDRNRDRFRSPQLPKTFGSRNLQSPGTGSDRLSKAASSEHRLRRPESKARSAPSIQRPATNHADPPRSQIDAGARPPGRFGGSNDTLSTTIKDDRSRSIERPSRFQRTPMDQADPPKAGIDAGAKTPRHSGGSNHARSTTIKDDRSRSIERPSRFQGPPQREGQRVAAPPPAENPKTDTGRRFEDRPFSSRPQIQQDRPRFQRPESGRQAPSVSRQRGDDGSGPSPGTAERRQDQFSNRRESRMDMSGGWQPRGNRGGAEGPSGQRFQRRFRD